MPRHEWRPFGFGLLHAVLAEHALPGGDHGLDRVGAESLRDSYQRNRRRIAPGVAAGPRDVLAYRRQSALPVHAFHLVNDRANGSNFSETARLIFTRAH